MKKASALALLLLSGVALAETPSTGYQYSDSKDTLHQAAGIELTEQERSLAKQWQLTESDWIKFKAIMQGPRGTWTSNLDPITALGVSETDPAERDRYAEIWMRVEAKRKEGELAFERSRQKAAKKVFGDLKAVKNDEWIAEWNRKYASINKAVALFVDSSCLEDCKATFDRLYGALNLRSRLDVYFQDGASGADIGQWAEFMGLDPEVVRQRKVTLNFDKGTAAKMGVDTQALPQVREVMLEQ